MRNEQGRVFQLRINSFFAGIGGFDLAFEREGFKVAFQSENNDFCSKVLRKNWGEVVNKGDIKALNSSDVPAADIWTGGFPCQDVSVARAYRTRDGLSGKNSGLFFNLLSLIRDHKPKIILLENVPGLLSSNKGKDFNVILDELSGLGYWISWRVLNARYFGSPQSRPRVFIIAGRGDVSNSHEILFEKLIPASPKNPRLGFTEIFECPNTGAFVPRVAYCLAATSGRHTGTDWSRTYVSYKDSVRRLTPLECERLQGFPDNWTHLPEESHQRYLDDTPRYHALGNSVSVPTIQWIARRIKTLFQNASNDISPSLAEYTDVFRSAKFFEEKYCGEFTKLENPVWRNAGICAGDKIRQFNIPQCPSMPDEASLIDIVQQEPPANNLFLSPNAARGIIRRVDAQGRSLFQPMREALERMSQQF